MKKLCKWLNDKPLILFLLLSFILNLVVEILSRRTIIGGFSFLIFSPLKFLYNMMLVFLSLTLATLFRRRYFAISLISIIWLGLGITNCVVLGFRTTPLGAIDFKIITSAFDIIPVYLSTLEIVLVICIFIVVIVSLIYAFIKMPKSPNKPNYFKSSFAVFMVFILCLLMTVINLNTGILSTTFKNIANAYRDYGFAYCFTCTVVDRGIDKPADYSKDAVDEIITEIKDSESKIKKDESTEANADSEVVNKDEEIKFLADKKHPNIIMLQLESFFDVNYLKNVTYSEDPLPVFRHLKDTYSSGFLTVPTIGAGTANTEFEIITGMSLEFFGPGEYPYTTILKSATCETINYNLRELGYKTHAIHNHKGTFYGRNTVYSQLGFETFTSVEYMSDLQYNPIGWVKDNVLTNEITKTLNSTEGRDLVYTISVQGHGRYPSVVVDTEQKITVDGVENEEKIQFEYFVNQINEMDNFIGSLISTLESYDEPTILVMYGDHLPAFEIKDEDLDNNNIFQTEYVIWNNFGLEKNDKDLYSYQLTSYLLNSLGIDNGVLTKFHQTHSDNENYMDELEMLEHDMLYGEKLVYDGQNPYIPTKLQMGIDKIEITSVKNIEDFVYITGKNFTKYSEIYINGKKVDAKYKDKNMIIAPKVVLKDGDKLTICQVTDDKIILSTSDEFIYKQATNNND